MSIADLAKGFVAMLKRGDHSGAAAEYNAEDIVSYEPMEGPMAVCHGKEAVHQKSVWWADNHEMHGGTANGPYIHGDQFAVHFTVDVTAKANGQRMQFDEIGVYEVKHGKIASERFYFLQP